MSKWKGYIEEWYLSKSHEVSLPSYSVMVVDGLQRNKEEVYLYESKYPLKVYMDQNTNPYVSSLDSMKGS